MHTTQLPLFDNDPILLAYLRFGNLLGVHNYEEVRSSIGNGHRLGDIR